MSRKFGWRKIVLGLACSSAVVGGAQVARAEAPERISASNGDGLDTHLFRPAIDSKGFFSVNGADVLGHNDLSIGLTIDYGHNLMPLRPGHGGDVMLRHAFSGTLHLNYGIKNMLVVGISGPVILNSAPGATDIGPTGATEDDDKLDAQALGNIALHAKLRILAPDKAIGLALLGQVGYGVGGSRDLGSEPGFWYWPQAIVEKSFGSARTLRLGLNVGYRGHVGAEPIFGNGADGLSQLKYGTLEGANLLTGGFAASVRVLEPLDLVAETYATQQLGGRSDSQQRLSAEAMGGIKLFIEKNSFLMLSYGMGYTKGFEAAQHRGMIGFVFEPSIGDTDGDGIKDDEDNCPTEPEDFDGFQDTRADSPPGRYGCPDPDNDNDGIPDVDDRCPDEAEDKDGDQDEDGCPEGRDGDRDNDGILDSRDLCPSEPEDKDGFQDEDGCPDLDNDKDGIPDAADACPSEPETYNGFEDEDGCPDKGSIVVEGNDIVILEKIQFKTNSSEILPESMTIVHQVSETLKHHPEFTMVEVGGHADARGNEKANLQLTRDRAAAVVSAMEREGVSPSQIRSMGYGPYCPLDPASNARAWELNRRVEFKVVRTADGPTGVKLGCDLAAKKGIIPAAP